MYCINYVIKQGDTLYNISKQFLVSVADIMKANPMVDVYNLMVDEVLCIPVSVPQNNFSNYTTYLVKEGDTLGSILNSSHLNLADFMQLNDLNQIFLLPGTTLSVPIVDEGISDINL
jgi:LysM repeat protein